MNAIYRVLFTDDSKGRPFVALAKFDGTNGKEQALQHALLLADTWSSVEVVEIVAKVEKNLVIK